MSDRKPLVTVEYQTELDVASGVRQRRMFVKMYFASRDSGLLAAIPDRLWKMLCCLATYMNENGNCSPSQARIAKDLGVSRQTINERIQELLAFRFQGEPVMALSGHKSHGRFAANSYRIDGISGLGIFDGNSTVSGKPDTVPNSRVKACADTETPRRVGISPSTVSSHAATLTRSRTRSEPDKVIHNPGPDRSRICTHTRPECRPGFCYYDAEHPR